MFSFAKTQHFGAAKETDELLPAGSQPKGTSIPARLANNQNNKDIRASKLRNR
jgi:hypothetical protein